MDNRISSDELQELSAVFQSIRDSIGRFIVGNDALIELISIGLLSEGHVLLEGVPGTAKTTLVKAMAKLMGCDFKRVQCAVDSQPADIIGVRIWNAGTGDFELRKGPIFTNIMLIDEINRLPPKSQSAFIESMSERQSTIDGYTAPIAKPFFVIATQNPFEREGTFPLIEAQKDRFMFSLESQYLGREEELEVVRREYLGELNWDYFSDQLQPILQKSRIEEFTASVKKIHMIAPIQEYIRDLVMATRTHGDILLGVSSRGSIALVRGAKAVAALKGRDYAIPDDVKHVVPMAFKHRIILQPEAEISGITPDQVVQEILTSIEVP
jgi:MoxR-like ATPase